MNRNYDPGPSLGILKIFRSLPDYRPNSELFWLDWGPVFYRGRLDGSAKVLLIASDPGPTERIANRVLVGNAGQRVQGFLNKIGLTKSYACLNGHPYSLFPSKLSQGIQLLSDPGLTKWRNELFDSITSGKLQAIVAFGALAQKTAELWNTRPDVPVFNTFHPSYRESEKKLLDDWNRVVLELRNIITPDKKVNTTGNAYGTVFEEKDYSRIPSYDLPFGVPQFMGDDKWRRMGTGNNSVSRPSPDDRHTLLWKAPIQ
jgi:uracil-DNA glycosylase